MSKQGPAPESADRHFNGYPIQLYLVKRIYTAFACIRLPQINVDGCNGLHLWVPVSTYPPSFMSIDAVASEKSVYVLFQKFKKKNL